MGSYYCRHAHWAKLCCNHVDVKDQALCGVGSPDVFTERVHVLGDVESSATAEGSSRAGLLTYKDDFEPDRSILTR